MGALNGGGKLPRNRGGGGIWQGECGGGKPITGVGSKGDSKKGCSGGISQRGLFPGP